MKSIIFYLLIITSLHAADCVDCAIESKPFVDVVNNIESLQAPAVVKCDDVLKENAKKEYLDNFEKLPKTKRLIKGLNLEGSALELSYLHKMLGEKPSEKWKSAKECKNVLCALTKIYDSEETAARVLNIAKRDGYIVSASKDFTDENDKAIGQTFSPAEIRDIDLAYKMLPASFKKLGSLDKLKRLPNGYSSARAPMAAAYASPSLHLPIINYHRQGEITFLEGGFNSDKSWGPLVAVHELSHHVDYSSNKDHDLGISEGAAYRKLSGWKKKNTYKIDKTTGKKVLVSEWQSTKDKKFVTDYASTEPAEDFAESSAFYIYRPQELKSIDPEKYDFLKKNIFRGKEYLSSVEIPLPLSGLLKTCLDSKKSYTTYKERKYGRTSLSPNCLNNYFKEFLITDPNLCSYNTDQLKVTAADKIASQLNYLNNILNNAYDELPALTKECEDQNNYKEDCPGMKYFEKNNISAEKMNLSESETKNVQDSIGQKLHLEDFKRKNQKVIEALIAKRGKGSLLSEMLVGGLADKNKISNAYGLSIQKYFLENSAANLSKTLEAEGYKFDQNYDLKSMTQEYLLTNKEATATLKSFQETVLEKATKDKSQNLELIKAWATAQSLEDSPNYDELAESIRKFAKFKLPWKP